VLNGDKSVKVTELPKSPFNQSFLSFFKWIKAAGLSQLLRHFGQATSAQIQKSGLSFLIFCDKPQYEF
jgi:hypothetical protein